MILSRVIDHVKKQHWTAVALDFVIVVMGVFIGIQLGNWNAASHDREREARYLAGIAVDLKTDVTNYEEIRASALTRIAAVNYLLEEALGEKPPASVKMFSGSKSVALGGDIPAPTPPLTAPNELDWLWSQANVVRVYDLNNAAYEVLAASGDFSIIHDRELANAMSAYYQTVHNLIAFQNSTLRVYGRDGVAAGEEVGLAVLTPNDKDKVVALLQDNEKLAASLRTARGFTIFYLAVVTHMEEEARALAEEIEAGS